VSGVDFGIILSTYFGSTGALGAGDIISSFLGPAVLSFGLQLFQYRAMLAQNAFRMVLVTAFSSLFGMFSAALLASKLVLKISPSETAAATLTRCVTTPLAIAGTKMVQGDPSVAALTVVVTGILGASFGEKMLKAVNITEPVSVGLALGASAHGLGAASLSYDSSKFSAALVAMTLTGIWTIAALSCDPIRCCLLRFLK